MNTLARVLPRCKKESAERRKRPRGTQGVGYTVFASEHSVPDPLCSFPWVPRHLA